MENNYFSVAKKGYKTEEVDAFIIRMRESYVRREKELNDEIRRLSSELAAVNSTLAQYESEQNEEVIEPVVSQCEVKAPALDELLEKLSQACGLSDELLQKLTKANAAVAAEAEITQEEQIVTEPQQEAEQELPIEEPAEISCMDEVERSIKLIEERLSHSQNIRDALS